MTRIFLIALICLAATSAFAQNKRAEEKVATVINMTQIMLDDRGKPAPDLSAKEPLPRGPDGKEIVDPDPTCNKCPRLTLGNAVAQSLFATFRDETVDPQQKWARAVLAQRIRNEQKATLTAEEIAVVKRQIGKAFSGIILMQAYPLLDPNSKVPEVK